MDIAKLTVNPVARTYTVKNMAESFSYPSPAIVKPKYLNESTLFKLPSLSLISVLIFVKP